LRRDLDPQIAGLDTVGRAGKLPLQIPFAHPGTGVKSVEGASDQRLKRDSTPVGGFRI
jgi:hypothetical protein